MESKFDVLLGRLREKDGNGSGGESATGYIDVTSVDAGNTVTVLEMPVSVLAPSGKVYPIEKTSVTVSGGVITLDFTAFLAYENAASFSGTWRVYFAGGPQGDTAMLITSPASLAIAPEDNHVYRHTLAASDVITFDTTGLSASAQIAWELHLTQPATAVSFTLPAGILWPVGDVFDAGNTAPDMTTGGRTYVLVFRWDGSDILGNLAYVKEVSA